MTDQEIAEETFDVICYKTGAFERAMKDLIRRANRLGVPAPTYDLVKKDFPVRIQFGTGYDNYTVIPYSRYIVSGTAPKLDGWTFVARLEPHASGNVILAIPGMEVPEQYYSCKPACEHCNAPRNRKNYFIVKNEQGEHRMVGATCLKDFLGHTNPTAIAKWYVKLSEFFFDDSWCAYDDEDEFFSGGHYRKEICLPSAPYLANVAASIRERGWISRGAAKKAEENGGRALATADVAWYNLHPDKKSLVPVKVIDEDRDLADAVLAWLDEVWDKAKYDSDYMRNVVLSLRDGYVTPRAAGFAASAIEAYKRARREANPGHEPSEYVGEVGQRFEAEYKVEKIIPIDGMYGLSYLNIFSNEDGNTFSWFASKKGDHQEGDTIALRATVKAHQEYKGERRTVLTRGKVLSIIEAVRDPKPARRCEPSPCITGSVS